MIAYVVDTETTGLDGALRGDTVVEIGIAEVDSGAGTVSGVYGSIVGQELTVPQASSWVFRHTDLTPDDVRRAPPLEEVAREVRAILDGAPATSYNVAFDFELFLDHSPWAVRPRMLPCIMRAAAKVPRIPRRDHTIGCFPSLQSSYDVLCPDDPAGVGGPERHRALSDAVQAAHVLLRLIEEGVYPETVIQAPRKGEWVRLTDGSIARPEHPVGDGAVAWECLLVPCIPDLVQTTAEPRRAIIRTDALEAAERIDDAAAEERLAAAVGYTLASAERQAGRMRELAHVGDADDRFLTEADAAERMRGAGE